MRAPMLVLAWATTTSSTVVGSTPSQAIASFTTRFWRWRAVHGPISTDDLPRTGVVRPDGWAPNVSYAAIHRVSLEYEIWADELAAIHSLATSATWSRDDQADYWALTSAVSRVYWEQHVQRPPLPALSATYSDNS